MDKLARYSDEFIDELKENVDIVDLISDYLELKKTGNRYKGLCPFHSEKTPSFFVNPDNNFYHCFGCGAGGDTISFVMEIENLTFIESIKIHKNALLIPSSVSGSVIFLKESNHDRPQTREASSSSSSI